MAERASMKGTAFLAPVPNSSMDHDANVSRCCLVGLKKEKSGPRVARYGDNIQKKPSYIVPGLE